MVVSGFLSLIYRIAEQRRAKRLGFLGKCKVRSQKLLLLHCCYSVATVLLVSAVAAANLLLTDLSPLVPSVLYLFFS